ncbi:MAG: hypothetical protein NVSMB1_08790 [Polyangiales bacterium]
MNADSPLAQAEARIGSVLNDKWTLESLLGVGGMAAVYSGRHRNGARAAVKVLHPQFARVSEIRERFLREGYAANRVEHPGAVAVLDDDVIDAGPDQGSAYLVMELLEGELLDERVARSPLSDRELLIIASGVLDVLEAAHAHGVVHRDLKPDNLFLLRSDDPRAFRLKVLDFGLARIVEGQSVTRAGLALGTPAFMPPEQAAGRADEIDGRADIFSLGAVLFRLRTGKRIHDAPNAIELVGKMANLRAPSVLEVDPSVSVELATIIDRALQFHREDRFQTALDMHAAVRVAIEQTEGSSRDSELGRAPTMIDELPSSDFDLVDRSGAHTPANHGLPARVDTAPTFASRFSSRWDDRGMGNSASYSEPSASPSERKATPRTHGGAFLLVLALVLTAGIIAVYQRVLIPSNPSKGSPSTQGNAAAASQSVEATEAKGSAARLESADGEAHSSAPDASVLELVTADDSGEDAFDEVSHPNANANAIAVDDAAANEAADGSDLNQFEVPAILPAAPSPPAVLPAPTTAPAPIPAIAPAAPKHVTVPTAPKPVVAAPKRQHATKPKRHFP